MQATLLREDIPVADGFQEEYQELCAWAAESRRVCPFVDLALLWHGGLLKVNEGRRIETGYELWRAFGGLG